MDKNTVVGHTPNRATYDPFLRVELKDLSPEVQALITLGESEKKYQERWEKLKLSLNWQPTEGYDCEEEKGFQKGIQAEDKLILKRMSELEKEGL